MTDDQENTADESDTRYVPEVIIQQYSDPLTGGIILQMKKLASGFIAVDLESSKAEFFGKRFLPVPIRIEDRPGKPRSRWLYLSS